MDFTMSSILVATPALRPSCSRNKVDSVDSVRIIVKYRNRQGRVKVLNNSIDLHYDIIKCVEIIVKIDTVF